MRWVLLATLHAINVYPETGSHAPLARNVNHQKPSSTALLQEWTVGASGADQDGTGATSVVEDDTEPVFADPDKPEALPGSITDLRGSAGKPLSHFVDPPPPDPSTDAIAAQMPSEGPDDPDIDTLNTPRKINEMIKEIEKEDTPEEEEVDEDEEDRKMDAKRPVTKRMKQLMDEGKSKDEIYDDPEFLAELAASDVREKKQTLKPLPKAPPRLSAGRHVTDLPELAPSMCEKVPIPNVVFYRADYVCDSSGPPGQEGWLHGVVLRPPADPRDLEKLAAKKEAAAALGLPVPGEATEPAKDPSAGQPAASFAEGDEVPAPVAGQQAPAVTQEIPIKPGTNIFESPFGDFPDLASPDTQIKDELELWNLQAEKFKSIFVAPASPQQEICHHYYGVREKDATEGLRTCKLEFDTQVKQDYRDFKQKQDDAVKAGVEEAGLVEFSPKPLFCPACKVFLDFYPQSTIPLVDFACLPVAADEWKALTLLKNMVGKGAPSKYEAAKKPEDPAEEAAKKAEEELAKAKEELSKARGVTSAAGQAVPGQAAPEQAADPSTAEQAIHAVHICFSLRPFFGAILLLGIM